MIAGQVLQLQCSVPTFSFHHSQSSLRTALCADAVVVWACRARDAGVDALRMEALAPSAKRSRTGEAAGQPAGQPEGPAAKYASATPPTSFVAFI